MNRFELFTQVKSTSVSIFRVYDLGISEFIFLLEKSTFLAKIHLNELLPSGLIVFYYNL